MQESMRLNKYLSDAGVCSRREADRLIDEGKVLVNGKPAVTGMRVTDNDRVMVNNKPVKRSEEKILLLMNKPRGIICTSQKKERPNVIEFLNYPQRIYPVGRLDKESEGLLLLTNNGDLVNRIMRAGNFHEKEYVVTVDKPIDQNFVKSMSRGVPILDTVTRPCKVKMINEKTFRIILTQGLNRQIRRMCEYLGYEVVRLKRIRIMNLKLDGLKVGAYRHITENEWHALMELLKDSDSRPWKEKE